MFNRCERKENEIFVNKYFQSRLSACDQISYYSYGLITNEAFRDDKIVIRLIAL